MRLFWDRNFNVIVQTAGTSQAISELSGKRRDAVPIELQYVRGTTPELLAPYTVIQAVLRRKGLYSEDSGVLGLINSFTAPTDPALYYQATLDLNVDAVAAAFAQNPDIDAIPCMLEFTYQVGGSGGWTSSQTINFSLENDVVNGSEATPSALPSPADYLAENSSLFLPAVVDVTGGGTSKLDGWQLTAGLSVPRFYRFYKTGSGIQEYMLRSGTDAEGSPGIIRPDDYDGTTNQRVYEKIG